MTTNTRTAHLFRIATRVLPAAVFALASIQVGPRFF
jgi:hypothetical protein